MINWEIYTIRDLSGGMKWDTSPFLTDKKSLKYIVNFNTDKNGMFEKDTGYAQHGTGIAGATYIKGLTPFFYTGNQKFVAAEDNGSRVDMRVFNPSAGTWDAQSLSKTTAFNYEFATFLDGLFCVNYADATMFYNGTSWSTTTNVTNAPKAKYVVAYLDRLYLLNVDISGATHTSRVVMSSLPDPTAYTITWDTSDAGTYFDVSPKDGDQIMGAGKNLNRLLIFKEDSLWRYDTNTLMQIPGMPGTNNHRTIKNVLDWTIYFHKTGIYGISPDQTAKLSRDIQPIIDGVSSNTLDKLCAYSDGDNYKIYLGDIYNEVDHIQINKCVAVLNVAKNRWRIETLEDRPSIFSKYRDDRSDLTYNDSGTEYDYYDKSYDALMSANDYFFFGTSDGKIFKFDNTITTQNTLKVRSFFETWNHYFAGVQGRGQLHALKFYMSNAKRAKLSFSIDDGEWQPISRYTDNKGEIYYQFKDGVVGNRIKLKGSENGIGERVRLYGIDVFFTPQANII
jgi:hypothetical protein